MRFKSFALYISVNLAHGAMSTAGLRLDGEAPDAWGHKHLAREPGRTESVVQYPDGRFAVCCHSFCFCWLIAPKAHSERKRTGGPVLPNTDRSGQGVDRNTLFA